MKIKPLSLLSIGLVAAAASATSAAVIIDAHRSIHKYAFGSGGVDDSFEMDGPGAFDYLLPGVWQTSWIGPDSITASSHAHGELLPPYNGANGLFSESWLTATFTLDTETRYQLDWYGLATATDSDVHMFLGGPETAITYWASDPRTIVDVLRPGTYNLELHALAYPSESIPDVEFNFALLFNVPTPAAPLVLASAVLLATPRRRR